GRLALDRRDRGGPVGGLGGLEPLRLQQRPHHLADVGLVVDEQDARAHEVASTMANVAPPPVVSDTWIVPWWASIVCRTSASPRSTKSTSLRGPSGTRPNSANSFARRSSRSVSAERTSTATAVCAPERRT